MKIQNIFDSELNIQDISNKEEVIPSKETVSFGIHGIKGSFTHMSLLKFLKLIGINESNVKPVYLVEAKRVLDAVLNGEVDRGVIAVANSGSGVYVSSMKVMAENIFQIPAIYGMPVNQCLIVHPSIEDKSQIKQIFGHPKAIEQCARTLESDYPDVEVVKGEDSDDTALCVQRIAEGDLPKTTATLASSLAAELYGMKILRSNMQHDPYNHTSFLVIKRVKD